jgi:hypothetical protein
MSAVRLLTSYGIPGAAGAFLVFAWSGVAAQERPSPVRVTHVTDCDGKRSERVDLAALQRQNSVVADRLKRDFKDLGRQKPAAEDGARARGHHAGLVACFSRGRRTIELSNRAPEPLRGRTLYLVTVPKGDDKPAILDRELPQTAEILVLEADAIADVAALAKSTGRPVTLVTAEVARALGVQCRDAKVTVSDDGKSALIEEGKP